MKSLAVYCGSASPADPRYMDLARNVGAVMAKRDITVVYGGGRLGLMGAVADGARQNGGKVIGIIPEALVSTEVAHQELDTLHIVPGMHERKRAFTDLSDGFVTLPGGVGTMDELWEAISWAQLGYHNKPVGLLNSFGYYDHLIAFNNHMSETGFIRDAHRDILVIAEEIGNLLDRLVSYQPHKTIFEMKANDL